MEQVTVPGTDKSGEVPCEKKGIPGRDKIYCAVDNSRKSMTSSLYLEAPFCAGSQSEGAVHVHACSSITSSLFLEAPFCAVQVRARLQFLEQIKSIAHNILFTIPGRDKSFYFRWITSSLILLLLSRLYKAREKGKRQ